MTHKNDITGNIFDGFPEKFRDEHKMTLPEIMGELKGR